MQNLKKNSRIGIWMLFCMLAVVFMLVPVKKADAEERRLTFITAYYSGGSVYVGDFIDLEKLTVKGYYSDGKYEDITDYIMSGYVVEQEGSNKFTVYSGEKKATFFVNGRTVKRISAYYTEGSVTIGESLNPDKLVVYAVFSDGKTERVTDFDLPDMVVYTVGRNEFAVVYKDQAATFTVTGKEVRHVRSVYASYNGPAVIVGNEPARDDFYVTAIYNDGTVERVTEFALTPAVVEEEGSNIMVVSYEDFSAEVKVQGRARRVVSLKAEYIGLPVVVGKTVDMEDIKVIATFNDDSTGEVTNFTLSSSVIQKIGDNLLTVFCDGRYTRMTVRGVESEEIDYNHGVKKTIRDNKVSSRISIAVGQKADPDQVEIVKVDRELVKKAMHRLVKTDKYIAYEVVFNDPEQASFLPMTMKVTVPADFDPDNFAVYYTPNKKTIMAQMNGEFINSNTYEFKMFQPGTYIIADCTPQLYVESLYLEEGEALSMRPDRSYSLDPVILPHTATNKEVEYSSSRPAIVSVDKYGILTAKKTGTAIITVTAKDGSGKKCTLRVTVRE